MIEWIVLLIFVSSLAGIMGFLLGREHADRKFVRDELDRMERK